MRALEKGRIGGVSEDVLNVVAQALHLDQDERTYLFDLARAARPARRVPSCRRAARISRSRPVSSGCRTP
ncbi:hypothetical protein [Streptosporangium roseum]|uniref:hypothetical protein n=1 Tax=Streptosporangium roseum TaxID=2001 RepID=UPI001E528953|nr:hypothetical protein [Streptosporangium roseum]